MAVALSTVKSSPSVPALPGRELDTLTRRMTSALEQVDYRTRQIRASAAPSDNERRILSARLAELAASLVPGDPDEIARSIASLRAVLPSANSTEAAERLVHAAYVSVLQPFPMWAVNQVCRKYLDGSFSAGGFAPSPPEMATRCRETVARFAEERVQIEAILSAEVYGDPTPESMARAEQAANVIKSFAAAKSPPDEEARNRAVEAWERQRAEAERRKTADEDRVEAEERLQRLAKDRIANPQPVTVSQALAARLEAMKQERPDV